MIIDICRNIFTLGLTAAIWYYEGWLLGVFALHLWGACETFAYGVRKSNRAHKAQEDINRKMYEACIVLQENMNRRCQP